MYVRFYSNPKLPVTDVIKHLLLSKRGNTVYVRYSVQPKPSIKCTIKVFICKAEKGNSTYSLTLLQYLQANLLMPRWSKECTSKDLCVLNSFLHMGHGTDGGAWTSWCSRSRSFRWNGLPHVSHLRYLAAVPPESRTHLHLVYPVLGLLMWAGQRTIPRSCSQECSLPSTYNIRYMDYRFC